MYRPNLNNLICAVLRRSSSAAQGTSIGNQGKSLDAAIAQHQLRVVYEEVLEGVSGSVPGNRSDIDRIIYQKKTYDSFQLLLVPDASRFTRAGAGHGAKLLFDLRACGLMVLFVAEDILVHDELSAMYISFLLHAAHETAKAISRNGTNGTTQSFLNGRSPYCRRPPLGLDRMYSLQGKDLHIIRNLPDGTQQMLDPINGQLIRTFEKNQRRGVPNHYIKQKNEQVRLVRGDPKAIATVQQIFHRHLVDKRSYFQIAKELNDLSIPSAEAKEWHTGSVRAIVTNPVYVGRGIRYRNAQGIYYNGGKDSATPSGVELKELAQRAHVCKRMRQQEDWREQGMQELTDFLQEPVRELDKVKIEQHLASIADGKAAKPQRDRHRHSPYLLKGILHSRQGDHPMSGRCGKGGRYYAVSRGTNVPKSKNVLARRVKAEPIERVVLEHLKRVFSHKSMLMPSLRRLIQQQHQAKELPENKEAIEKQLLRKRRQLVLLSEDVVGDESDEDPILMKLRMLRQEIRQLEAGIKSIQSSPPERVVDPEVIIEQWVTQLQRWMGGWESGADIPAEQVPQVREILSLLVGKLQVDLVSKELEMELSLPAVLIERWNQGQVGLDECSACKAVNEAHLQKRVIMTVLQCDAAGRPLCYACRRKKNAA